MHNNISNFRKTHRSVKNKNIKTSSSDWLKRHINDIYVQKSKPDGYRSRAAYKLLEIDQKFNVFLNDGPVLDLGCAPGSWIQVVKKITPHVKILGIDLIKMEPISNSEFICGDIYSSDIQKAIKNFSNQYSVIMSDISPNTTGIKNVDHLRILNIAEEIFNLSKILLKHNGTMICKLFHGVNEKSFFDAIKKNFAFVTHFKPNASRKESNEIYLVAKKFKS